MSRILLILSHLRRALLHHPHTFPGSVIRQGDWKLIQSFDPGREELYHLGDDPSETADLMSSHPEKADELRAALDAWRATVGAEVMRPNPAYRP